MAHSRWQLHTLVATALALGLAVAGCAKQPSATLTSAPAPTGLSSPANDMDPRTTMPAKLDESMGTNPFGSGPTPWGSRPSPAEFFSSPALKDVFFAFDRYDISPAAAKTLEESAAWLKDNSRFLILIEGHTDERGTNEYNLSLGERRAKATMNFLASRGVQTSRVGVVSYGEERPQCPQHNEGCWTKNRRARFLIKEK